MVTKAIYTSKTMEKYGGVLINFKTFLKKFTLFQNVPPEQRYSSQLEQLAMMGFVDREANIRGM